MIRGLIYYENESAENSLFLFAKQNIFRRWCYRLAKNTAMEAIYVTFNVISLVNVAWAHNLDKYDGSRYIL
jgi:hypothetical protein